MKSLMSSVQQLGRALMLPIAVLPIAGLLLRLGQPDLCNVAFIAAAGDAIFSNLGLIFAIGLAVGLAHENHGAAALAGAVGYLVASKGTEVLINVPAEVLTAAAGPHSNLVIAAYKAQELAKLSVPLGLISGIIAGFAYNRFSDIRLPGYLAFFAGRRFVPIVTGALGLLVAVTFGLGWPYLERGMNALSHAVLASGYIGVFAYGVLNRILIVTGLHHIINNLAWFLLGDFHGVTGDLKRFFAGDPSAGTFMSGFFPVMMFGLPAACLAMYHAAKSARRRAVSGLLLSMALTSFLTGVTEPIEFTFIFLAPLLYAVHAVMTGLAMVVMNVFDVKLGFSFSAGFFDYILNFNRATHPLLLLPVGAVYFAAYYGVFRFCIVRFDLRTPGREPNETGAAAAATAIAATDRAGAFVSALGGASNLRSIDACTTRLRLLIEDRAALNDDLLRKLGASGVVQLSATSVQVVVGPVADQIASELRAHLKSLGTNPVPDRSTLANAPSAAQPVSADHTHAAALLAALGGRRNVECVESAWGRLLITMRSTAALDEHALRSLGVRDIGKPKPGSVHLLVNTPAESIRIAMSELLTQT